MRKFYKLFAIFTHFKLLKFDFSRCYGDVRTPEFT